MHLLIEAALFGCFFKVFVGPAAFAGLRDTGGEYLSDNDFEAGISGNFGLNVLFGTIELYGQVTPR